MACWCSFGLPANAQTYRSDDTAIQLQGFGGAAVIGGGEVLVGSVGQTSGPGEVYIFRVTMDGEWKEAARLMASDGDADNRFGRAMAIDGSTLLIGATVQNDIERRCLCI